MRTMNEMIKQMIRKNRKEVEFRATLKTLTEMRAEHVESMNKIVEGAKTEARALTDEEQTNFNDFEKKIKDIDTSIAMEKRALELKTKKKVEEPANETERRADAEASVFANYIRGVVAEERADVDMSTGDNGAVIPTSIANRIIAKLYEVSPILQLADKYNVGGTLTIPFYDEASQSITMAYADEFSDLESTSGKFTNITLTGFLAGALTKISKKLINDSNFALVDFVVMKMVEAATRWIEKELLNGTSSKIAGLSTATVGVTAASATAVTADELIDLQESVIDAFQEGAIWIMNRATRKAIRKLKDSDGNYLLNRDVAAKWGYTLLGKDVFTSDNMPTMAAGNTAIFYGNMSGLAVKIGEAPSIEVLREKYAAQHAVGVICWLDMDAKIQNAQMIACLKMKASA